MIAAASVTVAAIVERQGRFLMVEEHTGEGIRLNQPAGHLERDETLVEAGYDVTVFGSAEICRERLAAWVDSGPMPARTFLRDAYCRENLSVSSVRFVYRCHSVIVVSVEATAISSAERLASTRPYGRCFFKP